MRLVRRACANGDLPSCVILGDVLMSSTIPHDRSDAVSKYEVACYGDNGDACARLGGLYIKGNGVVANQALAQVFLVKACSLRCASGCGQLAEILLARPGDDAQAEGSRLARIGAELGDTRALRLYGQLLVSGSSYVPRDVVRGRTCLDRACNGGDIDGCYFLALSLLRSSQPLVAKRRVLDLLRDACKRGSVPACERLNMLLKLSTEQHHLSR